MVVCRYFEQGGCRRGDTCMFEHARSKPEWLPQASTGVSASSQIAQPPSERVLNSIQTTTETQIDPGICQFSSQGKCRYGDLCMLEHAGDHTALATSTQDKNRVPVCTFFLLGACKQGSKCRFRHETSRAPERSAASDAAVTLTPAALFQQPYETPPAQANPDAIFNHKGELSRTLSGAAVVFGDGAAVHSVSVGSEISTVHLSRIPLGVDTDQIVALLASEGYMNVLADCIQLRPTHDGSEQVAEIKFKDRPFAKNFSTGGCWLEMDGRQLDATLLEPTDPESEAKELQRRTFSCEWLKPLKVAWLHFGSEGAALAAIELLGKRTIRGRPPQLTYRAPRHSIFRGFGKAVYSVQIGNLDVDTTASDLVHHLSENKPNGIKWGPVLYGNPTYRVVEQIKFDLGWCGSLSNWEIINDYTSVNERATARFTSAEDVRKAIRKLDGTRVSDKDKIKLHISPVVSIKLSVQTSILRAVQPDVDELRAQVREAHYVHIKIYDAPTRPRYTNLRIYANGLQALGKARGPLEKILAGTIATDGEDPIQDPYFFQPAGSKFIHRLMVEHSVFVYCEMTKMLLHIYGPRRSVQNAQSALRQRSTELSTRAQTSTDSIKRLAENSSNDAVTRAPPKSVTNHGSAKVSATLTNVYDDDELENQFALLSAKDELDEAEDESDKDDDDVCAVCGIPSVDPIRRRCGYAYCRDCLARQCSSASEGAGGIPIRCPGCGEVMTLRELSHMLPAAAFEDLVRESFSSYVRARQDVFRFCPTLDCDRVYRCYVDGCPELLCDGCFVDVCTKCHVSDHGDLSCADAKRLAADGEAAFEKWKEEKHVRACPKCDNVIEKKYGCNHLECQVCGIHMCWFCMATFQSSDETYTHMGKRHESIGEYGL